jgi:hypothetical protein
MPWIGQTNALGGRGAPPPARRRETRNETRDDTPLPGADLDPSWGPVGSLLKSKDPKLYERVLAQHESMVALERARKGTVETRNETRNANETRNETRTCLQCGVAFQPARANHRYCTNACRLQSFRSRSAA